MFFQRRSKQSKTMKHIFVLSLSFLMVLSILPMTVFAESDESQPEKEIQEVVEEKVEQSTPEVVEVKEELLVETEELSLETEEPTERVEEIPQDEVEPTEEAPIEEAVLLDNDTSEDNEEIKETPTDTIIPEDVIEEDKQENPKETDEPVFAEEKKEILYPSIQATIDTGLVRFYVNAPEGAFPENTEVRHRLISEKKVRDTIEDTLSSEVGVISAVDIYFYNTSLNQEVEPLKSVTIKVDAYGIKADTFKVVHIDDDGEAQVSASSESSDFSFKADSFSIYSVVGEENGIVRRTVNFYYDETLVSSQIVKNGDSLYEPDIPEKEGVTFVGWSNDEGNTLLDFTQTIQDIDTTRDTDEVINYYAIFEKYLDVIFHDQDGKVLQTIPVKTGDKVNVDEVKFELMAGEYVSGWTTSSDQTPDGVVTGEITVGEESIYLYPIVKNVNWLVFKGNGSDDDATLASYTAPYYVRNDENTHQPEDPTRPGYSFKEWTTDVEGQNTFTFGQKLTENTILYAQWNAEEVEYQIRVWKESLVNHEYVEGNYALEDYFIRNAPSGSIVSLSEEDEFIVGLKSNEDYQYHELSKIDDAAVVSGDGTTVLNVYFDLKVYKIVFQPMYEDAYLWGLVSASRHFTEGVIVKSDVSTNRFTKRDKIYGKETISFEHDGQIYRDYEQYEIEAHYGENIASRWPDYRTTKLEFTDQAPTEYIEQYQSEHEEMEPFCWELIDVVKSTMESYVTKQTHLVSTLINANGSDTIHVFPSFCINGFLSEANYWLENIDDNEFSISEMYSGKLITIKLAPKPLDGFTLFGTDSEPGTPEGYPETMKDGSNDQYHFYYHRNKYPLRFYNYNHIDEEYVGDTSIKYETPLAQYDYTPEKPSALPDDYEFKGWYTTEDCIDGTEFTFDGAIMPIDGLTLYAKWDAPEYTVTFNTNGGNAIENQIVQSGKTAMEPADPIREGYTFAGWTYKANPFNFASEIHEDTELVAKWLTDSYIRVEYDAGEYGSYAPKDKNQYVDVAYAIVKNGPKANDGYHFLGWKLNDKIYRPGELIQLLSSNATKISDKEYVITLCAEYGQGPDDVQITYYRNHPTIKDSAYVLSETYPNNGDFTLPDINDMNFDDYPSIPRNGFTFVGWSQDPSGEGEIYPIGYTLAADGEGENILYAIWEKTPLSIYYDPNGGIFRDTTDITEENYYYGDEITIAEAPVREGYIFLYWKGSSYMPGDTYTVVDNHTFIAQWQPLEEEEEDGGGRSDQSPLEPISPDTPSEKRVPNTSDSFNINLWIGLCFISIVVLGMTMYFYRRRKD